MSTVACPDCGQQISPKATSCPSCGRPRAKRSIGCFAQAVAAAVVGAGAVWWLTTGMVQQANMTMGQIRNQVADDAVAQYKIAQHQGDRVQRCVQAGMVAAAYLQAQDSTNYDAWKATERRDCRAAGIRK